MKCGVQVALAVGAGYLLGRHHKLRMALALAAAGATGKLGAGGSDLLQQGLKLLGSSPELEKLTESVRGELLDVSKAAARAAATKQIDSLTSRLHERAEALRVPGGLGGLVGEEEEEEEEKEPTRKRRPAAGRGRTARRSRAEEEPEEEEEEFEDEEEEEEEEPEPRPARGRRAAAGRGRTARSPRAEEEPEDEEEDEEEEEEAPRGRGTRGPGAQRDRTPRRERPVRRVRG